MNIKQLFLKHKIKVVVLVILTILLVREFGFMDFYYYKSEESYAGGGVYNNIENKNYKITVTNKKRVVYTLANNLNEEDPIHIKVEITKLKLRGNYFLPFYKNFSYEYEYNNSGYGSGYSTGFGNIKITGICSIRRAKSLVINKIIKEINKMPLAGSK